MVEAALLLRLGERMTKNGNETRSLARAAALPLVLVGAAIAAAEVGRRAYRETQIFCPSPDPVISWNPADYGIPPGVVEEHWIDTPDGERLHAWYCRAENPVASALFCHGNTGNLTVSAHSIPHLLRAGLSILFFDYRGYGRSSGKATITGVIADGVTAAKFHDGIRPAELPSILYGYSLGGAIGAQVLERHRFDAAILHSTFTSLRNLTRELYPRLPIYLLAGRTFDTMGIVRRLRIPLLVIHGTADEVVPCSMAGELFDACTTERRIHRAEGALHKDVFTLDPERAATAIGEFIAHVSRTERIEGPSVKPPEPWTRAFERVGRTRMRKTPRTEDGG